MLFRRMKGVHAPHRKHTADLAAVRMPVPPTVTIPLSMHIGAPAVPVVKPGDVVKVGQLIAEAGGFVSAPIHSSVSGTVKALDTLPLSNGRTSVAVTIETDGEQTVWEGIKKPDVSDYDGFIAAVRASGAVGLGGAGFPTAVKLAVKGKDLEAVIVNGAECEPYITSDTRTMLDDVDALLDGLSLLDTYLHPRRLIVAVEKNKPECLRRLREAAPARVEIAALPTLYPQGGEKVLIYHTIGRVVPEGKLPIDVGAVVINCTTLAFLSHYVETGMPLVEKCVTVDGGAVREPKNVLAPIGASMQSLFDFCGGFVCDPYKVLYGGPMMGVAVPSTDLPVMKNTNAVLALTEAEAPDREPTPCIRCGNCVSHCPLRLNPQAVASAYKAKDDKALAALKINLCMECGCCSFICPAKRPLVQTNKLAKARLAAYQKAEKDRKEKEAQAQKEKEEKEKQAAAPQTPAPPAPETPAQTAAETSAAPATPPAPEAAAPAPHAAEASAVPH
ncbi:MAG: electron transport complex subunit RsxC, partial [Clostridia bacterium]|nr:electron transport complex subunit RsxC [Clostridia bacterium]